MTHTSLTSAPESEGSAAVSTAVVGALQRLREVEEYEALSDEALEEVLPFLARFPRERRRLHDVVKGEVPLPRCVQFGVETLLHRDRAG